MNLVPNFLSLEKTCCHGKFELFSKPILILLLALIFSSPFTAQQDSITVAEGSKTLLYITAGTSIKGSEFISNAQVVKSKPEPTVSKKKLLSKVKYASIAGRIKSSVTVRQKYFKKVQDLINKKVNDYFYPFSQDNQLSRLDQFSSSSSVTIVHYHDAVVSSDYYLTILKIRLSKEKFYSSVSFLQFSRLLDSFLRGPPILA